MIKRNKNSKIIGFKKKVNNNNVMIWIKVYFNPGDEPHTLTILFLSQEN